LASLRSPRFAAAPLARSLSAIRRLRASGLTLRPSCLASKMTLCPSQRRNRKVSLTDLSSPEHFPRKGRFTTTIFPTSFFRESKSGTENHPVVLPSRLRPQSSWERSTSKLKSLLVQPYVTCTKTKTVFGLFFMPRNIATPVAGYPHPQSRSLVVAGSLKLLTVQAVSRRRRSTDLVLASVVMALKLAYSQGPTLLDRTIAITYRAEQC